MKFGKLLESLFTRPGGSGAAGPHPGHAQRRVSAAAAVRRRRTADAPARRRRRTSRRDRALIAELDDATLLGGDPQSRRPRPGRPARCVRADRRHPTDGDHRLHDQGLRPADAGASAEPLVAADRRAVRGTRRAELGMDPDDPGGGSSRTATPGRSVPKTGDRLQRAGMPDATLPRPVPDRHRPYPVRRCRPLRPRWAARCST